MAAAIFRHDGMTNDLDQRRTFRGILLPNTKDDVTTNSARRPISIHGT